MNIGKLNKGLEDFISTDEVTNTLNNFNTDKNIGEIVLLYGIKPPVVEK